jgi:hypothetical protein
MGIISVAVHVFLGCVSAMSKGFVLAGFATAFVLVFLAICFCLLAEAGLGRVPSELNSPSEPNK